MQSRPKNKITIPYNFIPRDYQIPFMEAMDSGYKHAVLCWPRRHGKDKTAFCYLIKRMIQEIGNYAYLFPTASLARMAAWENIDLNGFKLLDHIPKELIKRKLDQRMFIELKNGSTLTFFGSDKQISVGTNFKGIILSEYALQNPTTYEYLRPILVENKGFLIVASTPRGHNHYYEMWQMAQDNKEWFSHKITYKDADVLSEVDIQQEISSGVSLEMIDQEYNCSFSIGQLGSFYGKCMEKAKQENRIGRIPYDENLLVYTSWDIGFSDNTSIIFFQKRGNDILIIDAYESHGYAFSHYLQILREKKYAYGIHYLPHDARNHSSATGTTYLQIANQSEYNFQVLQSKYSVMEGIEKVRGIFPRIYIDKHNCEHLIKCLLEYHAEWDNSAKIFRSRPLHNWASDFADSLRYLSLALDIITSPSSSMTKEKLRDMKRKYLGEY